MFFDSTSTPRYDYIIRDHLGNTRVVFSDLNGDEVVDSTEILSQHHYYAFGMEMEGEWNAPQEEPYRYSYNGKELNRELDLNWLSYGAREYDPAIGRFLSIDRFAEKYTSMSPYQYGANNPIKFIDINGDSIKVNGTVYLPNQTYEGDDPFVKATFEALNYLLENNADVKGILQKVAEKKEVVDILFNNEENNPMRKSISNQSFFTVEGSSINEGKPTIIFDPHAAVMFMESRDYSFWKYWLGEWGKRSPAEVLLHELGHAESYFENAELHSRDRADKIKYYDNAEERDVILGIENPAAAKLRPDKYIERKHHKGNWYRAISPISIEKR